MSTENLDKECMNTSAEDYPLGLTYVEERCASIPRFYNDNDNLNDSGEGMMHDLEDLMAYDIKDELESVHSSLNSSMQSSNDEKTLYSNSTSNSFQSVSDESESNTSKSTSYENANWICNADGNVEDSFSMIQNYY
jgi:hypothetical protein